MNTIKYQFLTLILFLCCLSTVSAQDDLLSRINELRASVGLGPYSLNAALNAAAYNQALWMVESGQVSHYQTNGTGPRDRANAAGYGSSWVSENIYMGSIATSSVAWNFWINSPIHYAGLTSPNYSEVGIASATGAGGNAFVLVFGNPSTRPVSVRPSAEGAGGAGNQQPDFVVGLDSQGNIMHEVQPGDTLGDIALIYGYTWDEIPYMLDINGITWDDIRTIPIGSVILVPPWEGTYTPTPPEISSNNLPESTEEAPVLDASLAPDVLLSPPPSLTLTPSPTATLSPEPSVPPPAHLPSPTATVNKGLVVRPLTSPIAFNPSPTPITIQELPAPEDDSFPDWLIFAIGVQLGLLIFVFVAIVRKLMS